MQKSFYIIPLMFLLNNHAFPQTNEFERGRTYQNAKVFLTSGIELKTKNLYVGESDIVLRSGSGTKPLSYPIENVQKVKITTGNNLIIGLLVGAAAGGATFLIIKNTYEKPKTETTSGPGFTSTTTTTKFMDPGLKALLVSAPVVLGAFIGSQIPGKWKTIYSREQTDSGTSLHLTLGGAVASGFGLGVQLQF